MSTSVRGGRQTLLMKGSNVTIVTQTLLKFMNGGNNRTKKTNCDRQHFGVWQEFVVALPLLMASAAALLTLSVIPCYFVPHSQSYFFQHHFPTWNKPKQVSSIIWWLESFVSDNHLLDVIISQIILNKENRFARPKYVLHIRRMLVIRIW